MSPKEYGVFKWDGMNMYRRADALKIYKQSAAAGKYADKLQATQPIEHGYVVRSVDPAPIVNGAELPEPIQYDPGPAEWVAPIVPPFNLPSAEMAAKENDHVLRMIEIDNWIRNRFEQPEGEQLRDELTETLRLDFEAEYENKFDNEKRGEIEAEIRKELEEEQVEKVEAVVEAKKSEIRKEIENDVSFDVGQALTDIKKDLEEAIKQYGSAYK